MFASVKQPLFPIRISVTSGRFAARDATERLMGRLTRARLDAGDLMSLELVLAEVLNNIVEHAYPSGSPAGPIHIECDCGDAELAITVTDQGVGMPGGDLPDGKPPNVHVELQQLPEGGFGWNLIHAMAQDVRYVRSGWENRLSFTLPLAGRADT